MSKGWKITKVIANILCVAAIIYLGVFYYAIIDAVMTGEDVGIAVAYSISIIFDLFAFCVTVPLGVLLIVMLIKNKFHNSLSFVILYAITIVLQIAMQVLVTVL